MLTSCCLSQGALEQSIICQGELAADGSQSAQLILGPSDPLQLVLVGQSKGKQWVYSQGSVSVASHHDGHRMYLHRPSQALAVAVLCLR